MSASSLDHLSDAELRIQLSQYGYPAGPVTQTTRKILLKKLKNLMESKTGTRFSMAAAKFSSDDTDDEISSSAKKKKKTPSNTRRQTMATTMPPPATAAVASPARTQAKKRLTRNMNSLDTEVSDNEGPSIANRSPLKEKITEKINVSPIKDKSRDGLEAGSDSDGLEELPKTPIGITKYGVTSKVYNDRTSNFTAADVNSPKSYESNWRIGRTFESSTLRTHTPTSTLTKDERYSVHLPKPSSSADSSKNDSVLSKDSSKKDDILANYESPYLSEFTRRLSVQSANISLSKPSLKVGSKYRLSGISGTPEVKESDTNGHYTTYTSPRTYPSSSSMTYVTSSIDKTQRDGKSYRPTSVVQREEVKNSQNMISMLLLGIVVLFFAILSIVYLGLEAKSEFPLSPTESDLPICTFTNLEQNKPGISCVPEELLKDTLDLLKNLYPALMRRAIAVKCDRSPETPYLSEENIITMYSNSHQDETKVRELLKMAHFLVVKNPQWKLNLVQIPHSPNDEALLIDDVNNLFYIRLTGAVGMLIREPDIPWQCHIKNQMLTVFTSALLAASVALAVIAIRKVFLIYVGLKEKKEKEIFHLVSEIINMLEAHHQKSATTSPGGTQESYLAINHIRDNLISPKDRKRLNWMWERAVKFLDENESRIRKEVQLVAGEEFQVWRWLPNNSSSNSPRLSSGPKMSKVWQGSAFETMDGSVNSPTCPPTPCLKIRHMFDPDVEFEEDWETKVKDAILEKCGDSVKILHIKVDRGSREGCVYIKCMSQDDAGEAYKALHGSWFDRHLVTVKYLRLERYHERFPEAVNFKTPLKPSNNQRLSMQAHAWTTSSDAN